MNLKQCATTTGQNGFIFNETREQNRVIKCIPLFSQTTVKRTDREEAGEEEAAARCYSCLRVRGKV